MNSRYSRQELFQPIGKAGQEKLRELRVFVMGAGALGSASSEMLVRAGAGKLTIVDRDIIDWTNLHRQQLYTEQDVIDQLPKAVAAERHLRAINRDTDVTGIVADVTAENILDLLEGHDVIVDGTDNMEIRLLLNDAAIQRGLPYFMGACVGSYGLTYPFGIRDGQPCLHCLIDTLPSHMMTCDSAGVISPIVVTVAARQVADVLKYAAGESFEPRLESSDLWNGERSSIYVDALRKPDCPSCSADPVYPFLNEGTVTRTAVLCGRDTVQLTYPKSRQFDLNKVAASIRPVVQGLKVNSHLAAFEFQNSRIVLFKDGRVLVHGMKDTGKARNLMATLLG